MTVKCFSKKKKAIKQLKEKFGLGPISSDFEVDVLYYLWPECVLSIDEMSGSMLSFRDIAVHWIHVLHITLLHLLYLIT
jgi:hypothetical protein